METTSAKVRTKSGKGQKVVGSVQSKASSSADECAVTIVVGKKRAPSWRAGGKIPHSFFRDVYLATPLQRVEIIRHGVPATGFVDTSKAMGVPNEYLYDSLKVPRATVSKKIANKATLSRETSERLLGLQKLIGQVEVMVEESGNPEGFNAAAWVARWLATPIPALGGKVPGSLMDTLEGQELVSRLLAQMQSGAYA